MASVPEVRVEVKETARENRVVITGLGRAEAVLFAEQLATVLPSMDQIAARNVDAIIAELVP